MIYKGFCTYCSLCCSVNLWENEVYELKLDSSEKLHLCPRGLHQIELSNHRKRLVFPWVKGEEVSWQEAEAHLSDPGSETAVISPDISLEDALSIRKRFKEVYIYGARADFEMLEGVVCSKVLKSIDEVGEVDAIFLFGDVFSLAPPIARRILERKYKNRVFVYSLDFYLSRTASFASRRWVVKPEEFLLFLYLILETLGKKIAKVKVPEGVEDLRKKAESFAAAIEASWTPLFVFSSMDGAVPDPYLLSSLICMLSGIFRSSEFYYILQGGNTFGFYLRQDFFQPYTGKVKGPIVVFGDVEVEGAAMAFGYFKNKAEIQIPIATPLESGGTFEPLPGVELKMEGAPAADGTKKIREIFQDQIEGGRKREYPSSFDVNKFAERFNKYLDWLNEMKQTPGLTVVEEILPVLPDRSKIRENLDYFSSYPMEGVAKLNPSEIETSRKTLIFSNGVRLKIKPDKKVEPGVVVIPRPFARELGLLEMKDGLYYCKKQEVKYE